MTRFELVDGDDAVPRQTATTHRRPRVRGACRWTSAALAAIASVCAIAAACSRLYEIAVTVGGTTSSYRFGATAFGRSFASSANTASGSVQVADGPNFGLPLLVAAGACAATAAVSLLAPKGVIRVSASVVSSGFLLALTWGALLAVNALAPIPSPSGHINVHCDAGITWAAVAAALVTLVAFLELHESRRGGFPAPVPQFDH